MSSAVESGPHQFSDLLLCLLHEIFRDFSVDETSFLAEGIVNLTGQLGYPSSLHRREPSEILK